MRGPEVREAPGGSWEVRLLQWRAWQEGREGGCVDNNSSLYHGLSLARQPAMLVAWCWSVEDLMASTPSVSVTPASRPDQSEAGRWRLLCPSGRATRPPPWWARRCLCSAAPARRTVRDLRSRFSPAGQVCPGASVRPRSRPGPWDLTTALSPSHLSSSSSGAGLRPGVRGGRTAWPTTWTRSTSWTPPRPPGLRAPASTPGGGTTAARWSLWPAGR